MPYDDRTYHVYIMSNGSRTSTYTGVTGNLLQRVSQHRSGAYTGFSKKYRTKILVYYEETTEVWVALGREKQIKRWRREKKVALIKSLNPNWRDLAVDLGFRRCQRRRLRDRRLPTGPSALVVLDAKRDLGSG